MTKAKPSEIYGDMLDVFLHDRHVGEMSLDKDDRNFFVFDRDYAINLDKPVLSLCFRSASGGIRDRVYAHRQKVHPFFSNLLPEGDLRKYITAGLNINSEREFFLLAALGADLPGAVTVKPHGELSLEHLADLSVEERASPTSGPFKFSLAGVQLKFSAFLESTGKLTIKASGKNGDHIIKVPSIAHDQLPEAEYATMKLAKLMGIQTAEVDLVQSNKITNLPADIKRREGLTLAVRRFDRSPTGRIHIEDFAQVFEKYPAEKYEGVAYHDIASVLNTVNGSPAVTEFVRRLVFTIGTGNADMHLKNWSLLYRDGKNAELAPAYDLVPTIAFHEDNELGLSLGREKLMKAITIEHFAKFAAKAQVSSKLVKNTVKEAVEQFLSVWAENKNSIPFPLRVAQKIDEHLAQLSLFKRQNI